MADNYVANPGTGGQTFASDDIAGVQHPRVKIGVGADGSATDVSTANPMPAALRNAAGTAIGSLALGTAVEGIMTAQGATDFFFSTANATTAQLAAGATFTGTVESIISAQAWSILLTSDQPGTLVLSEFIDAGGTRVTTSKSIAIAANVPFSRAYTANGNYFRLTFQNTGAVATTTLNINTAFGVLPAVTNLGNAPVALNEVNGTALSLGQGAMAASLPVVIASNQSAVPVSGTVTATGPLTDAQQRAFGSTLAVTATGAVNAAVTATLPAAGVGLFHYITSIQVMKLYNVVGVAAGAGVIITSTNIPGTPAWTTEQLASPAGTVARVIDLSPALPIKSSVANTATTIVAPLQLQTIWRINVTYYTGP